MVAIGDMVTDIRRRTPMLPHLLPTPPLPTPPLLRGAAEVGPAKVRGQDGRELVRRFGIHPQK